MRGRNNAHYKYTNTVSFFGDSIRASALQLFVNAAHILQPFIIWPIVAILGFLMNWQWHASFYVLAFIPIAAVCISTLVWVLPPRGFNSTFIHGSITVGLLAILLFAIDLDGWSKFSIFMMIAAVPLICLTWSVRIAVESGRGKGLEDIFEQAGIPGANMTIHKTEAGV